MTKDIVLEARKLVKQVSSPEGPLTIVDDVDFQVTAGESVAIVGASGAGKSTLLALLAGLDTPTRGSVLLAGEDLTHLDEDGRARLRAARVGFVFQSFHLVPALTALENVMLPLELAGRSDARPVALAALERVGLKGRTGHYPRQLSGGEQQRVAIARALAAQPSVLVADEPVSALDVLVREEVLQLLSRLINQLGLTLVLISHDLSVVAQLCDKVAVMQHGRIIESGATQSVFGNPQHQFTRELIAAVPQLPTLK